MFKKIFVIGLAITALALAACSDEDSSDEASVTSNSYNGPGSEYSVTLNSDNTFTISESDAGWTASGTYVVLDSGFNKLTVASVTGSGGPSVNDAAYMLDVPGTVALLKPISANSEIIPMVVSGDCPTTDFTANWVTSTTDVDNNISTQVSTLDLAGTFSYVASSNSVSLPTMYAVDGTSLTGQNFGAITCSSGTATPLSDAKMYLTSIGGAIVRTGLDTASDETDDNIIVALPQDTLSSWSSIEGNYAGLVFAGGDTTPVSGTVNSANTISVSTINVDTNTADGSVNETLTLSGSVDSPGNGFFLGTLSNSEKVICMATTGVNSTSKNIIFCAGQDLNPNQSNLFSVMLVSK